MAIDRAAAQAIAQRYVAEVSAESGIEAQILESFTIEDDFGWVYFYDSKKHMDPDSLDGAVAGNAPIIVARADGLVHVTGTAHPIQHYIAEFRRRFSK